MSSPALGLLFGVVNSVSLHLAKGLQRLGIGALRVPRASRTAADRGRLLVYIAGVVVNNAAPVWIILANRFAPPAYATSMFGVGLIALMLYSRRALGEPVTAANLAGSIGVLVGTILFALSALSAPPVALTSLIRSRVWLSLPAFVGVFGTFVILSICSRRLHAMSIAFGIFAGGLASFDPILKALGQGSGGAPSFFPGAAWGWLPFLVSFLLGSGAFFCTQIAFYRRADASLLVPAHSSMFVLTPLLVTAVAHPGFHFAPLQIAGIGFIVVGMVLSESRWRIRL